MKLPITTLTVGLVLTLTGCETMGHAVNPFYEPPKPVAFLGQPNDHELSGKAQKEDVARAALEQMASYQRASLPQPNNPVVQPSVVRLMWIPDHLNRHGDLVPAHYYYVKVLDDRWAVTDAFELEGQLHQGEAASSAVPFVNDGETRAK